MLFQKRPQCQTYLALDKSKKISTLIKIVWQSAKLVCCVSSFIYAPLLLSSVRKAMILRFWL